jgi:hypothetical protein
MFGESGYYSSETKHDKRKTPSPELSASKRRLQKQRPYTESRPSFLVSIPGEDGFSSSETKHCDNAKFVRFGEITGTNVTKPEICPGFESLWRCLV